MANDTKTTRPKDAEIAQAMGWRQEAAYGGAALAWKNAEGIVKNLPYFHADHAAKHALLVWLSEQGSVKRGRFQSALTEILSRAGGLETLQWARMLATPEQVAEAALAAIRAEAAAEQKEKEGDNG